MVLVTNNGKALVLDRVFQSSPTYTTPSRFKVGMGTTVAALVDTDLDNPVPIQTTESVDDCETADWNDSADMTTSLNSTTFKENLNSLDLTKDAGASATASTSKTTTSRDFTNKEFSIWVYVKDSAMLAKLTTTDCLTLRFGSAVGDYYQWTKDASDFSLGWNLFDTFTSSNPDSTTGTPVIAACDYTYVGITADAAATVWSAGDLAMDDLKLISSDDYYKDFEVGYPVMDYTAHEATEQCRLNTLQANGYALTEIGLFNTDGTAKLMSRALFSSISKTSSEEIIFDVIYEIV